MWFHCESVSESNEPVYAITFWNFWFFWFCCCCYFSFYYCSLGSVCAFLLFFDLRLQSNLYDDVQIRTLKMDSGYIFGELIEWVLLLQSMSIALLIFSLDCLLNLTFIWGTWSVCCCMQNWCFCTFWILYREKTQEDAQNINIQLNIECVSIWKDKRIARHFCNFRVPPPEKRAQTKQNNGNVENTTLKKNAFVMWRHKFGI